MKVYQVIEELELKDLALRESLFTWKGVPNNQRRARLDIFLICDVSDTHLGGTVQSLLHWPTSVHFLVLLEGGRASNKGPLPFRLENICIKGKGFKDLVEKC